MGTKTGNVAEIQVVGQTVRVVVPKGTTLADTFKLGDVITEVTRGLNGCQSCTSGTPVEFIEQAELRETVRVDLDTMQRV
jgi:hypothetical protein